MISKRIAPFIIAATMIFGFNTSVFAELFSVSVGIPVAHSFASEWEGGDKLESDGVSGAMVHVKFPIMLGIGYETYKTSIKSPDDSAIDDISLTTNMLDFFWLTPVPVINFTIGAGIGTAIFECEYEDGSSCSDIYESMGPTSTYQLWGQVGYSFLPFLDAHLSYHAVTAKVKEKDSDDTTSFNGSVVGLGVAFIF
jgi:hypothetical protein